MVQATVWREGGNDEIVAVKKLKYHEGMEIRKFSNVRLARFLAHVAPA